MSQVLVIDLKSRHQGSAELVQGTRASISGYKNKVLWETTRVSSNDTWAWELVPHQVGTSQPRNWLVSPEIGLNTDFARTLR